MLKYSQFLFRPLTTVLSAKLGLSKMSTAATPTCRRLDGKVAVVTASTDGIGFAIAERLGKEGAKVIISSRKQKNVDSAVEKLKKQGHTVCGLVCHVSNKDDRKQLFEKAIEQFGGIDILVSNAASNPAFGPFFETSEEAWDKVFDVNVKATFLLCREAVPYLQQRGGGSIVVVSSIGGYVPFDAIGVYSISKTALLGLIKVMSSSGAHMNIRVNGIAPGIIKTRFSQALWSSPSVEEQAVSQIPLGRLGDPEDCAGTVAFLVSDDAKYITGETVVIAGGTMARL